MILFHSGFGSRLAIPPGYKEICARHNKRIIVPNHPGLGKTLFIEGHPDQWNAQLNDFVEILQLSDCTDRPLRNIRCYLLEVTMQVRNRLE